jgi:starch synthase (maltosyl-transferring)
VIPPLIYNLFPRLIGPTSRWPEHTRRAADMGFNWIYLNPWHYPGFSGSLYAPKEFMRLNPLFLPPGVDERSLEPLREYLAAADKLGLSVMMDLIVNHTSKDCVLVEQHPSWYRWDAAGTLVSPSATDPDNPNNVTVWGDLAELDHLGSPDREGLWRYFGRLVRDSVELGFAGFRCDAAFMVPAALWKVLIEEARAVRPDCVFFAETLGAPEEAVLALRHAGFDFLFNSSKWWNFRDDWALDQHVQFGRIAPSISFPETHDTPRLAEETGGDEAIQRQRYAFAIAFSAGVMMPIGYEFGFRRRTDVVRTMPSDWERRGFDLRPFVKRLNSLKLRHPVLQGEGRLTRLSEPGQPVLLLERTSENSAETGIVVVNTRSDAGAEIVPRSWGIHPDDLVLHRVCEEGSPAAGEPVSERLVLRRAEVAFLLPEPVLQTGTVPDRSEGSGARNSI